MMRFALYLMVSLAALCALSTGARALTINIFSQHMYQEPGWHIEETEPYANQKMDASPTQIRLTFSRPVNGNSSRIRVIDEFGMDVGSGEIISNGKEIISSLPDLPPGRYRVKWRARCACDGMEDLTDSFRFTVLNPKS